MRYPRLKTAAAIIGCAGIAIGYALAQTAPIIPRVIAVNATADKFIDAAGGQPHTPSQVASAAQINAAEGVQVWAPTDTAQSIQVKDATNYLFINTPGAQDAETILLPLHPSDGQHLCLQTVDTITTPTYTAASGTTLSTTPSLPTVVTAAVQYCFRYIGSTATWYYTATG